jgi:predicted HAD superfamily Cof-like phosphohydrolase
MKKEYLEPKGLNDVAEFHRTFNLPIENKPVIPAKDRCALRVNLLQEELNELKDAIADNDLTEIGDALADLQYVLSGAILEFGLADSFKELFDEVQRSNLSKACDSESEAVATQEAYNKKDGTESYIEKVNGKFVVYRKGDHKVLKSIRYSPANLKEVFEKHTD